MKKLLLAIAFIVLGLYANAQKPNWIKIKPTPTNNTYLYVVESATGKTEMAARNSAIAEVLRSTALRLGMPFESEAISKALQNGTDYSVISRQYNIPINKVCEYSEYYDYQYRVYILCQVAKAGNIDVDFDDFSKCYEGAHNDTFIQNGYNKYFSLALGNGISYGGANIIGLTASYRVGGRLGIEPHISLGISSQKYSYWDPVFIHSYYSHPEDASTIFVSDTKTQITYNVGLNIFVYKGAYLGINYGVQGIDVTDHFFDYYEHRLDEYYHGYTQDNDGYWHANNEYYNSYEYFVNSKYFNGRKTDRHSFSSHKGMSFLAGYKYYFGYTRIGARGYLDFGAGVKCYSETNTSFGFEKFDFAWNLGVGIAF